MKHWLCRMMFIVFSVGLMASRAHAEEFSETHEFQPPPGCGATSAASAEDCMQCHTPDTAAPARATQMMALAADPLTYKTIISSDNKVFARVPAQTVAPGQTFHHHTWIANYAMTYAYGYYLNGVYTSLDYRWPWGVQNPMYDYDRSFDVAGDYQFQIRAIYCGAGEATCGHGWVETTLRWTVTIATSGKTPVLFIPGLMATRLYKSGGLTQVWASTSDFFWDIGDDFLDPLEMEKDGKSDINDIISVYNNSPNGPAEDVSDYLAWDKYIFAEYNQSLFESLKGAGYRPAKGDDVGDFSFYAYDWRRAPENETIRTDLNARIDQLLTANSAQKVDIVAHSLGGLVLKDYLANLPPDKAHKIGKVILVGTPHLGAVKAFRAVQFGQLDFGFPSEIFMSENKIMQISQNWPVVYALSPSEAFCGTSQAGYVDIFQEKDVDLNKKDGYTTWSLTDLDDYYHGGTYYKNWYSNPQEVTTENQKHNGLLADAAKVFHRDRDALSTWAGNAEQVFLLAGQQTNTLQRLELFKNPEEYFPDAMGLTTYWMSGDGTVPTKSASLDFDSSAGNVSRYYIRNVEHAALVAENRETSDFVRDILLSQIPADLSSNISNTPFADTVSGRHIEVNCPVEVHVYDAQGRHTGPINSREVEKGLTKVDYERYHAANGFSTSIFLPPENVYRIVIVSQGSGTFRLTNRTIQDDIISQTVIYDEMPLTPQTIGYLTLDPQTAVPPLSIDVNGDQQIDLEVEAAAVIASDERADRIPPVTSVAYMGSLGQNGFYASNVSLILNALDGLDGTGVKKTEYSLDGGSWTRYLNPVTLSEGCRREVRYRSLDYSHNQEDSNNSLVKIDKSTPTIQSVTMTPNLLWPPNHRMVEVVPSVLVTDNCSASPVWAIESIRMNEGDTENTYDPNFDATHQAGDTNGDIQIIGGKIYLRAERAGNSAGRTYTIVVKATDEAGNVARAEAMVLVPHDQR